MFNPKTAPYYFYHLRAAEAAASSIGIEPVFSPISNTAAEIEGAIESVARVPNGGLLLLPDSNSILHRDLIIALATRYRLGGAHDFNNLLTVIVGNLNIAQRHLDSMAELSAERLRRLISNAVRGAERATTITKQLLAFSRKDPFDPKPLNINRLVHDLSDFLRRSLGETITLDIRSTTDLWRATADPVQLEAAILNLAVNARDAMAEGGKLTITTKNAWLDEKYCQPHDELLAGPYVIIAVCDTGAGMSKEILQHVFEPFFTTKKAGEGTGLGLHLSQKLASLLGATIACRSQVGTGSQFSLAL